MKRILLAIVIIALGASTACSSALSLGQKTSDSAHAFLIHSAQMIDKINGDISPEGKTYLVIKYEIENLQSQNDSHRRWTDQIILEASGVEVKEELCEPTLVEPLDNQLWETSLLPNEVKEGYIVFTAPENALDFDLTFTFPESGNEVSYDFRYTDKRIKTNVDHVLTKLEQIERGQRIPLIGGVLTAFTSSPIRYLGIILVPEEEVSDLLEQTGSLSDEAKHKVIEDYLLAHGRCNLE